MRRFLSRIYELMHLVFDWFARLLSGSDDVSSNRLVGVVAFLFFLYFINTAIHTTVTNDELLSKAIEYLFYIIVSALGLKGIEKIVGYFKNKE